MQHSAPFGPRNRLVRTICLVALSAGDDDGAVEPVAQPREHGAELADEEIDRREDSAKRLGPELRFAVSLAFPLNRHLPTPTTPLLFTRSLPLQSPAENLHKQTPV
jgi:hypothetical protein